MNRIIGLRNPLLVLAAIAVTASVPLSERLEFDQRLESFFADDNPDIVILRRSRREFGGDEFVIVAWTEEQLLRHDIPNHPSLHTLIDDRQFKPELTDQAHERITTLSEKLSSIPGVNSEQTQSLVKFLDNAPKIRAARRAVLQLFAGTLIGDDARSTSVVLTLEPEDESPVPRSITLQKIRSAANDFEPDSAIAGEPVLIHDMFRLVEEDSQILFLASLGVLAAVLLILFGGFRWMLGTIGLVLGVVICTRAVLVLFESELSMVGSMLNSLVTVIGIATCMHVIVHYRDLRLSSADGRSMIGARQAANETMRHMAVPVFWTCVTTGVGFGSLLVSEITPVRSFSVMMVLATTVIIVACVLILPAMMASGRSLQTPSVAPLEHRVDRTLALLCNWLECHPRKIGITFLLITIACIPGIFRLDIETDFSRNFKESSTIVQSLKFIESRLGGAGTWEVAFDTPEELTDDYLNNVSALTSDLKSASADAGKMRILSLADVANLPPRIRGPEWMLKRMELRFPKLIAGMYNKDKARMRIVLRSLEQQSADSRSTQIENIRTITQAFAERQKSLFKTKSERSTTASGMFVLLTEIIHSLLQDQLRSFLCATAGIFLCMTVAFRSLRIGLISLFPNIFPVALLLGSLGWTGVPVNIGTAMIASVSMGLTVDSTIHYIFAFERARRVCNVPEALQRAHVGAGRAVVFAHLALIAGFAVLTASRFIPLVYFGGLMSLSMFCGLFGDLVLLPLLLRRTTPVISAASTTTSTQIL
ncbi:MAG: MMPL family transporter [Fuerstiella sp.]|nr:MMPL family transporter [Fuerstiella sp.]